MNSIELLSCFFQLLSDVKAAQVVQPDPDQEFYVVTMFIDMDGDDDE